MFFTFDQPFVTVISCSSQWSAVFYSDQLFVTMISCLSQWSAVRHSDQLCVTVISCSSHWSAVRHSDQLFVTVISCLSQWSAVCHSDQLFVTVISWSSQWSAVLRQLGILKFSHIDKMFSGLGICSSVFWRIARFLWKNERMSDSLKKLAIRSNTHFWWATWVILLHRLFLVSDLSDSLTSLIKIEGMSESLGIFLSVQKRTKNTIFIKFFRANRSFAHLSWATWAICSQALFWHEQPERFAHSRSFVLSNMSESLTFAHLIWANEQMSDEQMSVFPALDILL